MKAILEYIQNNLGITISDINRTNIENYINKKLSILGITLIEYLNYIERNESANREFVDKITINETYFFREERHFDTLKHLIIPKLDRPIKIWSAACSTGEEAISLYLLSKQVLRSDELFQVSASDINNRVLDKFKSGIYSNNSFRKDGEKYHDLFKEQHVISKDILDKINIENLNLFNLETKGFLPNFDIIFLRNTLIYFSKENKNKIVTSVINRLKPGGYIFFSSTETPFVSHHDLKLVENNGIFYFVKKRPEDYTIVEKVIAVPQVTQIRTYKLDYYTALTFAADKINNKLFVQNNSIDYDHAILIIEFYNKINLGEYNNARKILNKMQDNNALINFLEGFLYYNENEKELAKKYFNKSIQMDIYFWPACFYLSTILKEENSPNIGRILNNCIRNIDKYIENNSYYFQVLLDGFNGKYFKRICISWLK